MDKLFFTKYPCEKERWTFVLYDKSAKYEKYLGKISFNKNYISYIESVEKRRGHGTIMLKEVESHLKQSGYNHVSLIAINDSEKFYIKNGFKSVTIMDCFWYNWTFSYLGSMIKRI